jgi:predicted dehydrogenase
MAEHHTLVIGCGSIGERHLRCFQATGRTVVTGCDTNPVLLEAMASKYGVPVTHSWETAVQEERFDTVVICTPAPFHVPMALRALDGAKHVLVEKPLSHSLAGVEELLQARDRHGSTAAVAYVLHQYPLLNAARQFLRAGELGHVMHASIVSGQPFHLLRPAYAQTYYRQRATGGGAIQDALTHSANWIESVLGPTESVMCECAHRVLSNVEVEDTVTVSARHLDGTLVSYSLNQFQAPNESFIQFNTATGSVRIEIHEQRWGVFRTGDSTWRWQSAAPSERDTHFLTQANAFLDAVEGRPAITCSLEAALQTLRFNLAALASANSGKRTLCATLNA